MAAQCQHAGQERLALPAQGDHAVGKPIAHHRVVIAPVGRRGIEAQVFLPCKLLPARSVHVRRLVGEVQIAAIGEAGGISCAGERTGQRGQVTALGRELHDRHAGLGRESAQDSHLAPVGAERVGEEIFEPDAFALQALHVGHDGQTADIGIHDRTGETFENNHHDIGARGRQHPLGSSGGRVVPAQAGKPFLASGLVEEGVFGGIVGMIAEAREERKDRVGRRMIQKHVRTEIGLRHIGDRSPQPAADGEEIAPGEQQQDKAPQQRRTPAERLPVEQAADEAVDPDHERRVGDGQQGLAHPEPEIDARHSLLGVGKVNQDRRIEAEAPMLV